MAKTFVERFVETPQRMRRFQQERAILEITHLIVEIMEDQGITRAELARRLGKTKGYVTQILDGEANKTIRTIADVFAVLGRSIHVTAGPLEVGMPRQPMLAARSNGAATIERTAKKGPTQLASKRSRQQPAE